MEKSILEEFMYNIKQRDVAVSRSPCGTMRIVSKISESRSFFLSLKNKHNLRYHSRDFSDSRPNFWQSLSLDETVIAPETANASLCSADSNLFWEDSLNARS